MTAPGNPNTTIDRRNFHHMVMDIFWFGLAFPSTSRFLAVYAIRLGATPFEVGLLTALPALALLIAAMFSIRWRARFTDSGAAITLPSLGHRFVFLLPAFTPFMPPDFQSIWLILALTLPAIPQGIASVVFLVLMRESVPADQLTPLVGRRALVFNIGVALSTLAMGFWLEWAAFPLNYQMMFVTAYALTMISFWHVKQTRSVYIGEIAAPPEVPLWRETGVQDASWLTVIAHLAFFFVFPIIPIYVVEELGAGEGFMALFIFAELMGAVFISSILNRVIGRLGERLAISLGLLITGMAVLVIVFAAHAAFILAGAALTGIGWTMAGTATFTFFSKQSPDTQPTRSMLYFNQMAFVAVCIAPLAGTALLGSLPIVPVMLAGAALRIGAGFLVQFSPARGKARRSRHLVFRVRALRS